MAEQSPELTRLEEEVNESTSVQQSAIALITGLAAQVRATAGDREKSLALADSLDQSNQALAAAVAANTPGGEQPTE